MIKMVFHEITVYQYLDPHIHNINIKLLNHIARSLTTHLESGLLVLMIYIIQDDQSDPCPFVIVSLGDSLNDFATLSTTRFIYFTKDITAREK